MREVRLTLEEAFTLFRRLGVDVQSLSPKEFTAAFHRLAWRYHPDRNANTPDLMANINAARTAILHSYRRG
jgi:DnaJ-class molecular chaperone